MLVTGRQLLRLRLLAVVAIGIVIIAVARFQINRSVGGLLLTKLSKERIQTMAVSRATRISRHHGNVEAHRRRRLKMKINKIVGGWKAEGIRVLRKKSALWMDSIETQVLYDVIAAPTERRRETQTHTRKGTRRDERGLVGEWWVVEKVKVKRRKKEEAIRKRAFVWCDLTFCATKK